MDPLTSSIVGLKSAEMHSRVQVAVARKILETNRLQGSAAIELLQAAASAVEVAGSDAAGAAISLGAALHTYG